MKKRSWIFLLFLLAASFLLFCLCGRYSLSPGDLFEILSGQAAGSMKVNIFWNVRVARTCTAGVCGAALALSGFVYQGVFHNPLVSPDVLGVSGGASVGAISAILFFGGSAAALQILSFLGGMATVLLALLLARAIGGSRTFSLVIAGIVLSALMNAAVMAMKYMADPIQQLAVIDYWLMGSYSLCGWDEFFATAPLCTGSFLVLALLRYRLKVLTLGDQEAISLGVAVTSVRAACIAAATVLVAAFVSVSGIVSWVGLMVPHLARAVMQDAPYLLLDEPVDSLDFSRQHGFLTSLREYIGRKEAGCLMTIHDPGLAYRYCDRLILIHNGGVLADVCTGETCAQEALGESLKLLYGGQTQVDFLGGELILRWSQKNF